MLKLGSNRKGIGTPVACPTCRYPNLGIYIWCDRCGAPLDWKRPSPGLASDPSAPLPVVPAAQPEPATVRRIRPPRVLTLPRITGPAVAWPRFNVPRLSIPGLSLPRLGVPRVAATVFLVAAVLILLVIVAVRQGASSRLPLTNGAPLAQTALAAAIPGIEAKTGLHYHSTKCATTAPCLTLASQTVGQDAAAVVFSTATSAGRQCVGYVYRSGSGWHFLDGVCGLPDQLSPLVAHDATVHLPANCANVRERASLKAHVAACLNDGTTIHIDGGPTYADSRLWWHERQGWIAHDFLVIP
jgi:hypothetical protein